MLPIVLLLGLFATSFGEYKRVCYYTNWAQYRPEPMKFFPENIDTSLCTHFVYAFATMKGNQLAPYEWNDDDEEWAVGMYTRFNSRIHNTSNAKSLLAVGGWNFGTEEMTAMLATKENREEFVTTTIVYLRQRDFDGFDLDYEYPGSRGSPPEDKQRFTLLIQEFRAAFEAEALQTGKERLLLTAAVGAGKSTIDNGYEIALIAKELDFINLMSYDLNGAWLDYTGHNSPLFARSDEQGNSSYLNQAWAANYWHEGGAPKDKLIIGMATYGRCFTLVDEANDGLGAPVSGPCAAGPFTREAGFLSYYEVCPHVTDRSAKYVWHPEHQTPYATKGKTWIGYDNDLSLSGKVTWLMEQGYGGWMVWDLDLDDFTGTQCPGDDGLFPGEPYHLIKTLNRALGVDVTSTSRPTTTTTTSKPGESTTKSTTTTTPQPGVSTTTGTSTTAPAVCGAPAPTCSVATDEYQKFAKTNDCSGFLWCVNGLLVDQLCAPGTYFDPISQYCKVELDDVYKCCNCPDDTC